jgi:hypothetical protein
MEEGEKETDSVIVGSESQQEEAPQMSPQDLTVVRSAALKWRAASIRQRDADETKTIDSLANELGDTLSFWKTVVNASSSTMWRCHSDDALTHSLVCLCARFCYSSPLHPSQGKKEQEIPRQAIVPSIRGVVQFYMTKSARGSFKKCFCSVSNGAILAHKGEIEDAQGATSHEIESSIVRDEHA